LIEIFCEAIANLFLNLFIEIFIEAIANLKSNLNKIVIFIFIFRHHDA